VQKHQMTLNERFGLVLKKTSLRRSEDITPELMQLGVGEKRNASWVGMTDGERWLQAMGVDSTKVVVSAETVMGLSAYYACVDLISNSLATAPLKIYKKIKVTDATTGKERTDRIEYPEHANYRAFAIRANRYMSPFAFKKDFWTQFLVYGNAVAEPIYNANRRVTSLNLLTADKFSFLETFDRLLVQTFDGRVLDEEDYIHVKDLTFKDKIGKPKFGVLNKSIKIQMSAEEYLRKYYEKGTAINGYLKIATKINSDTADEMSLEWDSKYGGSANNFKTPVLGLGAEYQKVGSSNVESQMVELLSMAPTKIYQMFLVPPSLVSDTSKSTSFGTGMEDLNNFYLQYNILPKIVQFEEELNYKCFWSSEAGKVYVKHNMKVLERVSFASQIDGLFKLIQGGMYNPNMALKKLDENGYDGGDTFMVNGNMMTVENVKNNVGKNQLDKNKNTQEDGE
jgi:HK97 family phage portal protein